MCFNNLPEISPNVNIFILNSPMTVKYNVKFTSALTIQMSIDEHMLQIWTVLNWFDFNQAGIDSLLAVCQLSAPADSISIDYDHGSHFFWPTNFPVFFQCFI